MDPSSLSLEYYTRPIKKSQQFLWFHKKENKNIQYFRFTKLREKYPTNVFTWKDEMVIFLIIVWETAHWALWELFSKSFCDVDYAKETSSDMKWDYPRIRANRRAKKWLINKYLFQYLLIPDRVIQETIWFR